MPIYRTDEEREAFDPGPCPHCGATGIVDWIEVPTAADSPPYPTIPGTITCSRGADCPGVQIDMVVYSDKQE